MNNPQRESQAIKKYVRYIKLRMSYLKADVLQIRNENEYYYYEELLKRITEEEL